MSTRKIEPNCFKALFGVAEAKINPPAGIYFRNWAAAEANTADGFHSDLMMQCLAIKPREHTQSLFIITADLGWWMNAADEYAIRQEVLEGFGLEPAQLIFCLSHTHAGPSVCSNDKKKPGGEYIVPYLQQLKDTMKALMQAASQNMQAGRLSWEYGKCSLAVNRDMPGDGTATYWVGYNPDKIADDTLLFGHILSERAIPICSIVNYACHPTTLAYDNRKVSPDFIGSMRETISGRTKVPCLFLQGASGDLAPMIQYVADTAAADANGRQLGYAALSVYEHMLPPGMGYRFREWLPSGAPLAIWEYSPLLGKGDVYTQMLQVEVPLKPMPSLQEIQQEWAACKDTVQKDRLWRKLNTRLALADGTTALLPVWIWKLGDTFIVAQPNEAYSYFQKRIRESFPDKKIVCINIANGYIGYLPTSDFYDKDIYACNISSFAKGSLEILTDAVIDCIRKM